ncbi:MAG: endonuclease MutS2 [Clostridia bacterium]|nr:endonuclease MutS2 [Clostridia bacterium]
MADFQRAQATLEFDKIKNMLAECALTEGAKEAALALEIEDDVFRVRKLQLQTTDAKRLDALKGKPPFGNLRDVTPSLDRAEKGAALSARELLDIAAVFTSARRLREYILTSHAFDTLLDQDFELLTPDRHFEERVARVIVAEDMISDEASPALSDIRRKIRAANNKIKDILHKYTTGSNSKYLQDNIVTTRNGRYVIPVKQEYKNEIKGLVHDTSASGATLFIEPMGVVSENNKLRELEGAEEQEINRILATLSADAADRKDVLIYNYQNITELALIFARAELSSRMNASAPEINERREFSLRRARHPLLDPKKAVPINVSVGGSWDTLVITGPNTGGKTVTLKTLGLLALMVQSGLHIPCDVGSSVCVFERVLADIGDEQSIEQSLSTFSAHMVNIVDILDRADERSLVLFDELGAGTDPVEGAALATAILEEIRSRGALCAATTHYAELKVYALDTEGVCNASCEFDVETLKPTYKLITGTPGKSNAFAISGKLGLDPAIISRARGYVSGDERRFEYVIEKLETSRIQMEAERDAAAKERAEFEAWKREKEAEIARDRKAAAESLEKAEKKALGMIQSARMSSDYVLDELEKVRKQRDSEKLAEGLDRAREKIRRNLRRADDKFNPVVEETNENYVLPRELRKGDRVMIVNLGCEGVVLTPPDRSGNVQIRAGIITTKTKAANLRLIEEETTVTTSSGKKQKASAYSKTIGDGISPELDLRGQNGDDAWILCDKYLDDAVMAGLHTVTLIHGKGTGALKAAVRKYLRTDRRVKNFREGMYGEGDGGVTVVELK